MEESVVRVGPNRILPHICHEVRILDYKRQSTSEKTHLEESVQAILWCVACVFNRPPPQTSLTPLVFDSEDF